jgi:hypothetical protein
MNERPLSWLVIERGWTVVAADGVEVGRIDSVVGDANADIFDGLAVAGSAVTTPRYVPAENVGEITSGRVAIDLDASSFERLPPYEPPAPTREIVPENPSVWERITGWFRRPG